MTGMTARSRDCTNKNDNGEKYYEKRKLDS